MESSPDVSGGGGGGGGSGMWSRFGKKGTGGGGSSSTSTSNFGIDEKTSLLRAERKLFQSLRGDGVSSEEESTDDSNRSLGTFNGVFAPVVLSMFSSVLFLRMGYIVGNAGLPETLLQLAIAYSILGATILSISAIATNGAVEVKIQNRFVKKASWSSATHCRRYYRFSSCCCCYHSCYCSRVTVSASS